MTVSSKSRALLIAGSAGVYWLAMFTGTHIPSVGLGGPHWLDKVEHAAAYFGLAVLLCAAVALLRPLTGFLYLSILLSTAAYGAVDELTQKLVPGRTASFWDWLADISGALCGVLVFYAGALLWRRGPGNGKNLDARPLERG